MNPILAPARWASVGEPEVGAADTGEACEAEEDGIGAVCGLVGRSGSG